MFVNVCNKEDALSEKLAVITRHNLSIMTVPMCNLCKSKLADKKNSHIIPKFLCTGLFESTTPRYSVMISKNGKSRKIQDTPKENHILCTTCEKRIEILETHFARVILGIHNFTETPNDFKFVDKPKHPQYLECV